MRTSIAVSIVILAMTAGIGWHLDQRLAAARTLRSGKLVSEATPVLNFHRYLEPRLPAPHLQASAGNG